MTPPSHSSVCYSSQSPCTLCDSAITLQQVAIILWSRIIMMAAYFKRLVNRLYKALSVDNTHNYTDPSYIPNRATYGMQSIFVITGVSGGVHKG